MNKVAHYNGFVGRCQQYGLTKQAADMLYKRAEPLGTLPFLASRLRFAARKGEDENYQSNGWAPRGAPTASDKPWLTVSNSSTAIPATPYDPGSMSTGESYGTSGSRLADEATGPMYPSQELYNRANPNFAGWRNAHQKSVRAVLDQYPEFGQNGKYGPSGEAYNFRDHPETANHMSKIYHDSMYNLTNNTPKVTAPTLANR